MHSAYSDPIYGPVNLPAVLTDLMNTPVIQRLKGIHQSGPVYLINPDLAQTRFEHSVGVMLLIRKLGGHMRAQIAGLLHDMAHTAFSHLIDYVLEVAAEDYHEKRHEGVLEDAELQAVLLRNGFPPHHFAELELYPLLEYPKPGLSADRIDYTLRDQFHLGLIRQADIDWFLEGMQVQEGRIVLAGPEYGAWFQQQYQALVQDYFKGRENAGANSCMTKLVRQAMKADAVSEADFWRDDAWVVGKLETYLGRPLGSWLQHQLAAFDPKSAVPTKARFVDPEVWVEGKLIRMSAIGT